VHHEGSWWPCWLDWLERLSGTKSPPPIGGIAVPTPHANPYGMIVNSGGVPFFTEFGSNKLASIDPNTLQIHEYVLPHAESRPRRIAITSDDVIWYSDYARGALGRFDPETNTVKEWPSPGGPESGPYGITTLNDSPAVTTTTIARANAG
jgi:streptogramin lyase